MADEQEKPTAVETGEATTPPTDAAPVAGAEAPVKKAPAKKGAKVATPAKGTTGASTTTADGAPVAATISAASQALNEAAAGFTTVTGSDETQSGVYNGEPPMSADDRYKASIGRDPLQTKVPDGAPYGNMGLPHVATKSDAPIGPTGNTPTGAPHADVATATKLNAPLAKEQAKSDAPPAV